MKRAKDEHFLLILSNLDIFLAIASAWMRSLYGLPVFSLKICKDSGENESGNEGKRRRIN